MTEPRRHRLHVGPLALIVAAALAVGCGSGDEGTVADPGSEGQPAAGGPAPGGTGIEAGAEPEQRDPAAGSRPGEADKSEGKDRRKGSDDAGKQDRSGRTKAGTRGGGQAGETGTGSCPDGVSSAQCRAEAERAKSQEPSHTVNVPGNCTEVMSQSACEAKFEAEKAAQGSGGGSVSLDECLQDRTRARCEEQLAPQLEAERARADGE